jgi:hypothetical protein
MSQELLEAVRRLERSNRRWRRLALTLSSVLALVLLAGVTIGVAQQRRAAAARAQAEQAEQAARVALLEERDRTVQAEQAARKVAEFLRQAVPEAQPATPQP